MEYTPALLYCTSSDLCTFDPCMHFDLCIPLQPCIDTVQWFPWSDNAYVYLHVQSDTAIGTNWLLVYIIAMFSRPSQPTIVTQVKSIQPCLLRASGTQQTLYCCNFRYQLCGWLLCMVAMGISVVQTCTKDVMGARGVQGQLPYLILLRTGRLGPGPSAVGQLE